MSAVKRAAYVIMRLGFLLIAIALAVIACTAITLPAGWRGHSGTLPPGQVIWALTRTEPGLHTDIWAEANATADIYVLTGSAEALAPFLSQIGPMPAPPINASTIDALLQRPDVEVLAEAKEHLRWGRDWDEEALVLVAIVNRLNRTVHADISISEKVRLMPLDRAMQALPYLLVPGIAFCLPQAYFRLLRRESA